jgi:hypothetical protein
MGSVVALTADQPILKADNPMGADGYIPLMRDGDDCGGVFTIQGQKTADVAGLGAVLAPG